MARDPRSRPVATPFSRCYKHSLTSRSLLPPIQVAVISWSRRYARWWAHPYDFSRTADHIDRAILSTDAWLAQHGLQQGEIPYEMRLHSH